MGKGEGLPTAKALAVWANDVWIKPNGTVAGKGLVRREDGSLEVDKDLRGVYQWFLIVRVCPYCGQQDVHKAGKERRGPHGGIYIPHCLEGELALRGLDRHDTDKGHRVKVVERLNEPPPPPPPRSRLEDLPLA